MRTSSDRGTKSEPKGSQRMRTKKKLLDSMTVGTKEKSACGIFYDIAIWLNSNLIRSNNPPKM